MSEGDGPIGERVDVEVEEGGEETFADGALSIYRLRVKIRGLRSTVGHFELMERRFRVGTSGRVAAAKKHFRYRFLLAQALGELIFLDSQRGGGEEAS